jgi:hypothetical protein
MKRKYIVVLSSVVLLSIFCFLLFIYLNKSRHSVDKAQIKSEQKVIDTFSESGKPESPETSNELSLDKNGSSTYNLSKEYTSEVIKADKSFNAIVPIWTSQIPEGTSTRVYLKAISKNKDSGWVLFEESGGKTGSLQDGEYFPETPLLYAGDSYQYRVLLKSSNPNITPVFKKIRFELIDSSSNQTLKGFLYPSLGMASAAGSLKYRAEWGCPEANSSPGWPPNFVNPEKFIIHHTASQNNPADPAADIRAIWYYHAKTRGWGDIGYNYIIDQYGTVYEGRFGGRGVVGGHTENFNSGSIGIALLGTFDSSSPASPTISSLTSLVGEKAAVYNINPWADSYINGKLTPNVAGHITYSQTGCPGSGTLSIINTVKDYAINDFNVIRASRPQVTRGLLSGRPIFPTGAKISADFEIKNTSNQQVIINNLGVASRLSAVTNKDLSFYQNIPLNPGDIYSYHNDNKADQMGDYNSWITYYANGTWYDALASDVQNVVMPYSVSAASLSQSLPVTTSLSVGNSSPAMGQEITPSFSITNNTGNTIVFDKIGVASRNKYWQNQDFPFQSSVSLPAGETYSFPANPDYHRGLGLNTSWVAYNIAGTWYEAAPASGKVSSITYTTRVPNIRAATALTSSPVTVIAGQPTTYSTTIWNNEDTKVYYNALGIAARDIPGWSNKDLAWNLNSSLPSRVAVPLNASNKILPAGTYYAFTVINIGGNYIEVVDDNNAGNHMSFVVGSVNKQSLPVTTSLSVGNSSPAMGQEISPSFSITNNTGSAIVFDKIGVASRNKFWQNQDFPFQSAVTLPAGETYSFPITPDYHRGLGLNTSWVAYNIAGVWYEALPASGKVSSITYSTRMPNIRAAAALTSSPVTVIAGQPTTYSTTLWNNEDTKVYYSALGIAARDIPGWNNKDLTWTGSSSLPSRVAVPLNATNKILAAGTYYAFTVINIGGNYIEVVDDNNVGNHMSFSAIVRLATLDGVLMPATSGLVAREQHLSLSPGCTADNVLYSRESSSNHYRYSNTPLVDQNGMAWETSPGITCGYGAWGVAPTAEDERYYINMRWNYTTANGQPYYAAKSWYYKKRVIVTNPINGKSVVASVIEYGPGIMSRVAGLSPEAMSAIGAQTNDSLEYYWAANQLIPLGPMQ